MKYCGNERTLFLLSDGARRVIGEHIQLHFSHLKGFVDNFSHLEGLVDNFGRYLDKSLCFPLPFPVSGHLEGFVDNFCRDLDRSPRGDPQFRLKSGGRGWRSVRRAASATAEQTAKKEKHALLPLHRGGAKNNRETEKQKSPDRDTSSLLQQVFGARHFEW